MVVVQGMVANMVTRQKGLGAAAGGLGPVKVVDMMTSVPRSGTMSVPAHNAGDMLLVVLGDNSKSVPALLSGFTNIITGTFDSPYGSSFDRCFRLQYYIDTYNVVSHLSFSTALDYGEGLIIRNAVSVPNSSVRVDTSQTGTADPIFPALSGLTPENGNALVGGHYGIQNINVDAVSGPFDDWIDLSGLAYKEDHALSSFSQGTHISYTGTITRLVWCCEVEKG